jgi:hydrogenase-4 component H
MNILKVLIENLRKGPATEVFPFGPATTPAAYRGKVVIDAASCVACKMCEHVCAGGAIRFTEDTEGMHFLIWHNTCVSCGLCEVYCPTKAIQLTTDWHRSHRQEDKYRQIDRATIPFATCTSCGNKFLGARDALMKVAFKGVGKNETRLLDLCTDCRRAASGGKAAP